MTYFYQRIISLDAALEELDQIDLSYDEKLQLTSLIDSNLHNLILDEILSNLSEEEKRVFLKKLHDNPDDDKLLEFLKEKVEDIEVKIKKVSDELTDKIKKDIKESRQRGG